MTIDERIERLTERHEALTQSLELMRYDIDKHSQQIAVLAKVAEDCLASVKSLENIARSPGRFWKAVRLADLRSAFSNI